MNNLNISHKGKKCLLFGANSTTGNRVRKYLESEGTTTGLLDLKGYETPGIQKAGSFSETIIPEDPESTDHAIKNFLQSCGCPDYLILSWYLDQMRNDLEKDLYDPQTWKTYVDKWVMSYFQILKAVYPSMAEKGSGRIVFFLSTRGYSGEGEGEGELSLGGSIYEAGCASAITGMMTSIARDIIPRGISLNGIALGNNFQDKWQETEWALNLWLSGIGTYSCGQIYRVY